MAENTSGINVSEAARRMGCSRGHVYNLIKKDRIRFIRISKNKIKLNPADVQALQPQWTSWSSDKRRRTIV